MLQPAAYDDRGRGSTAQGLRRADDGGSGSCGRHCLAGADPGCCQCHDHKFDPFPTRDFYALGAFFADIQEPIIGSREPG